MSTADTWFRFGRVRPIPNTTAHHTAPVAADPKLLSATSSGGHRGNDLGTWSHGKSTVVDINIELRVCQGFIVTSFFKNFF